MGGEERRRELEMKHDKEMMQMKCDAQQKNMTTMMIIMQTMQQKTLAAQVKVPIPDWTKDFEFSLIPEEDNP